jgi:hypothetical protein
MADIPVNYTGKVCGMNVTSQIGFPLEADYWSMWPWEGWIRPQIDYAYAVGAGVIRIIGDVTVVNSGTISQARYNQRLQQFTAYCISLGMSVYYTGCATYGTDGTNNGTTSMSDSAIAGIIVSNIGSITGVSGAPDYTANIIGCDLVQEANANMTAGRCNNIYSLVKPNVTATLGCTFSTAGPQPDATWIASIINSCDYLDYHIYPQVYGSINSQPTPTDFTNGVMTTYPNKDLLFGEGGCSYSGPPTGSGIAPWAGGSAGVTAWTTGFAALGTMSGSHARGAMAWSVFEQDSDAHNQYGFFDAAGPLTPLTANYIYPWVRGWSTSAGPNTPPAPVMPQNRGLLLCSPKACSNDYTGVKFFRNGVLIATQSMGLYDDSANVLPGQQYTYTAKITTASHGDSAASSPLVWSIPSTRVRP